MIMVRVIPFSIQHLLKELIIRTSLILKTTPSVKNMSRELKDKILIRRNCLQETHLIKDCYLKYTQNS